MAKRRLEPKQTGSLFTTYFGYYIAVLSIILLIASVLSFTEIGGSYSREIEFIILTISVIFVIEILYRLFRAEKKLHFIRKSYFDIVTILPFEIIFGSLFRLPLISRFFRGTNIRAISIHSELLSNIQNVFQTIKEKIFWK